MSRRSSIAIITVFALLATGCATMNVSSHAERGVDFASYGTFDWGPADALPTGDPRLDNNPFFHDYLQGMVEKEMAVKGYRRVANGTPDLLLHYHANVSQRFEVHGAPDSNCTGPDCEPRVIEYEQGTLVLDIIDARTNKMVWRGWAQDSMSGVIDNQDRLEDQVKKAITRIMARFPRAL
jgi:hypothetical protein